MRLVREPVRSTAEQTEGLMRELVRSTAELTRGSCASWSGSTEEFTPTLMCELVGSDSRAEPGGSCASWSGREAASSGVARRASALRMLVMRRKLHAPGRIRTSDLSLRRRALYPLSYGRGAASLAGRRSAGRAVARPAREPLLAEPVERVLLIHARVLAGREVVDAVVVGVVHVVRIGSRPPPRQES